MEVHLNELSQRSESRSNLQLIAACLATVVALYLLVVATYDRSSVMILSNPSSYEVFKNRLLDYGSIVSVTGPGSAFGLFIPALLALFPLATRKYRRGALLVAALLTFGICLIWPLSIGILYLPAALLLSLAAVRKRPNLSQPAT